MNLELIEKGEISSVEQLIEIKGVDKFSLSFYLVANYEKTFSQDIEEIKKILKDEDLTVFISEFIKYQFENIFTHVSTFIHEQTVFYKIYRKDNDLEKVFYSLAMIQSLLEEIKAEKEIKELENIKLYIEKIVGVVND